jgi:hypothetical protein
MRCFSYLVIPSRADGEGPRNYKPRSRFARTASIAIVRSLVALRRLGMTEWEERHLGEGRRQ